MIKNKYYFYFFVNMYSNRKNMYQILNHLCIHKDNFHIIEDYLRYYLLVSNENIPYCYTILLAGILKKRVINAKNSDIQGFDSRHAKANIFSLMAIIVYLYRIENKYNEEEICKMVEVKNLLKIFNYYTKYIVDFLNENKEKYKKNVQKSLSIFSKINSSDTKSYSNDDLQYKYCFEWINKLMNYFFTKNSFEKKNIMIDILNDYYISQFMNELSKSNISHMNFFKLSISELNEKYISYSIDFFLDE
jgi:hypothetical protein